MATGDDGEEDLPVVVVDDRHEAGGQMVVRVKCLDRLVLVWGPKAAVGTHLEPLGTRNALVYVSSIAVAYEQEGLVGKSLLLQVVSLLAHALVMGYSISQ